GLRGLAGLEAVQGVAQGVERADHEATSFRAREVVSPTPLIEPAGSRTINPEGKSAQAWRRNLPWATNSASKGGRSPLACWQGSVATTTYLCTWSACCWRIWRTLALPCRLSTSSKSVGSMAAGAAL